MQQQTEVIDQAARVAPAAVVAGLTFLGYSLNDIVLFATLVYVLLQISFLLYKWWKIATGRIKGDDE
jgi:hypothetical protein